MRTSASPSVSKFHDAVVGAIAGRNNDLSNQSTNERSPQKHIEENFMQPSYPKNGTTVLPATNTDLREKFSAAIIPFQAKQIADSACRTPEAAKKWKQGIACPDLPSAINMARDIPAIKWLLYREIEGGAPEGMFSNRLVVDALAMLQTLADGDSEYAQRARAILRGDKP